MHSICDEIKTNSILDIEPSEVQNIQGEVLSNSSVLLKWQEPSDKNGILLYYKVIISDNRTIITETPYCIIDDLGEYMSGCT